MKDSQVPSNFKRHFSQYTPYPRLTCTLPSLLLTIHYTSPHHSLLVASLCTLLDVYVTQILRCTLCIREAYLSSTFGYVCPVNPLPLPSCHNRVNRPCPLRLRWPPHQGRSMNYLPHRIPYSSFSGSHSTCSRYLPAVIQIQQHPWYAVCPFYDGAPPLQTFCTLFGLHTKHATHLSECFRVSTLPSLLCARAASKSN